jgi:AhpD family alkylhydroperoxidase
MSKTIQDVLSPKVKELIAIGTSVGVHCVPCLQYHVQQGRAAEISEDEILEAIRIGKQVERGAIANMQKSVSQLGEGAQTQQTEAKKETASCC